MVVYYHPFLHLKNENSPFSTEKSSLKAEILDQTDLLPGLEGESAGTVIEAVTPLLASVSDVASFDSNARLRIDELSSWFGSVNISSSVARRYAEVLVQTNTGSVSKLQRKLETNSNYLEEIGGFDQDDIIDIKEGLKLTTAAVYGESDIIPPGVSQQDDDDADDILMTNSTGDAVLHSDALTSQNTLAVWYHRNFDKALPLYHECLEKRKTLLGENHPDTLTSLNNLAGLYNDQGDSDKALRLYEECLKRSQSVLGENHPETLALRNKLAVLYNQKGDYEKAHSVLPAEKAFNSSEVGETTKILDSIVECNDFTKRYLQEAIMEEESLKTLINKLKHPKLTVSVVGLVKSGKSSFIDGVVLDGLDLCPRNFVPETLGIIKFFGIIISVIDY
jgi:tetratricopeptide (TPR) repeat protein